MITIGIDFGTTKTLVACPGKNGGEPFLAQIGRGVPLVPTSLYFDSDNHVCIGEDADDMAKLDPSNYCKNFKIYLGSPRRILHGCTAKDLTVFYLKSIRDKVQSLVYQQAQEITEVVITCPVAFSPLQKQELKEAAHLAGFRDRVTTITEPEAAGLALCRLCAAQSFDHSAIVIDWGGGTLDLAVITRDGDRIVSPIGLTKGNNDIGGESFNDKLWNEVARRQQRAGHDMYQDFEFHADQMRAVRKAKEMLSAVEMYPLTLAGSQGAFREKVSRADFNDLIHNEVDTAGKLVLELMQQAALQDIRPQKLLFVGGSSNIPYIKERLQKITGLQALSWERGREAVVLGAAIHCEPPQQTTVPPHSAPKTQQREQPSSSAPQKIKRIRPQQILQETDIYCTHFGRGLFLNQNGKIIDIATNQVRLDLYSTEFYRIMSAHFDVAGKKLLVQRGSIILQLYDLDTKQKIWEYKLLSACREITGCHLTSDGHIIFISNKEQEKTNYIIHHITDSGKQIKYYLPLSYQHITFGCNDDYLVAVNNNPSKQHSWFLYKLADGTLSQEGVYPYGPVSSVSLSPNSQQLAFGQAMNDKVDVFELCDSSFISSIIHQGSKYRSCRPICYSSTGRFIASVSTHDFDVLGGGIFGLIKKRELKITDTTTWKTICNIYDITGTGPIQFSPDEQEIVLPNGIWDLSDRILE